MGLFNSRQPVSSARSGPTNAIPVLPFDLGKRYDVYTTEIGHDRLYEDVRFVCVRTFDRINEFSSGLVSGFLELEAADGSRCLVPSFHIRAICEHGAQPAFKVLRHRRGE